MMINNNNQRNGDKMTTQKYYILLEKIDNRWTPQFGDHDRQTVETEKVQYHYDGIKTKNLKIIPCVTSDKSDIEFEIHRINQGLIIVDAFKKHFPTAKITTDFDTDYETLYVYVDDHSFCFYVGSDDDYYIFECDTNPTIVKIKI